ncbi:transposase [Microbulbifer sp. TYP-18]|uniref:transposase n=1 Tax=Microbulbifer sp. TYP-18 TaxID=3230024 RepID=UPI0034C6D76A
MAFQKKKGLSINAMTSSETIYQELCNLRAGIESTILELKRAYGVKRVLWRGLEGFNVCVWSAIFICNVAKIVCLNLR